MPFAMEQKILKYKHENMKNNKKSLQNWRIFAKIDKISVAVEFWTP